MTDTDFTASAGDDKDRNFITALARGLDILRCYRPNESVLTNTDFAERTGLPKATVSRLTHTLCKLDYLVADPRTGAYRLGVGVLQLGYGVLAGRDICERARDVLRGLRDGPNSYITAALGEAHRDEALYIAVHGSRENVALTMHVGSRLPLFFSSMGRAILVGMSPEAREKAVEVANLLDPAGEAARQTSLTRALEEYRVQGFCTGYGDWRADVNAVAVPVVTLEGRVYGLNVGGPSFHVKPKQLEAHYAGLLKVAAGVLGGRG